MNTPSARILHEENGVRFVELSSTFDGSFCSPPAVERLDAAFEERSITIYRSNSEVPGPSRLTLSLEEFAVLVEAWRAYCVKYDPVGSDYCWVHAPGGWSCPDCLLAVSGLLVVHPASSFPSAVADEVGETHA